MRKRRFRQANYATESEILAINSKAVREDLYIATDTNKAYWINHDGLPQLISGGAGGANLSVGGRTSTKLDIQSDTGTNATVPSATGSYAGLMSAADKLKLDSTETSSQLNTRDTNNRKRSNHTGTQTASTISDFDTEVSNNSSVTANTAKVSASGSINTHSDVSTSGASAGDLLQYDGSDWVPLSKDWISLSTGTGLTGIDSSYKTIYIDRIEDESNSGIFTLSSNEITVNSEGAFLVTINIVFNDSTASDSQLEFKPEVYSGGSWSYLSSGGRVRSRFHVGNSVFVPINLSFIININSGDKLRFTVRRISAVISTAEQINNYTSCTINKL